ncbi:hypothetical protein [Tateyamaria sp.]|uniref:hypothetical protein n=1 Tax=Tateyamaria sp. TaxID=1929288 RepID=UPI0032A0E3F8
MPKLPDNERYLMIARNRGGPKRVGPRVSMPNYDCNPNRGTWNGGLTYTYGAYDEWCSNLANECNVPAQQVHEEYLKFQCYRGSMTHRLPMDYFRLSETEDFIPSCGGLFLEEV